MSLTELPIVVFSSLLCNLSARDGLAVVCTCRALNATARDPVLWNHLAIARWGRHVPAHPGEGTTWRAWVLHRMNFKGIRCAHALCMSCQRPSCTVHTPWASPDEFYGCGKFVRDSWNICCRGDVSGKGVEDVNLRRYTSWPRSRQVEEKGGGRGAAAQANRQREEQEAAEKAHTDALGLIAPGMHATRTSLARLVAAAGSTGATTPNPPAATATAAATAGAAAPAGGDGAATMWPTGTGPMGAKRGMVPESDHGGAKEGVQLAKRARAHQEEGGAAGRACAPCVRDASRAACESAAGAADSKAVAQPSGRRSKWGGTKCGG